MSDEGNINKKTQSDGVLTRKGSESQNNGDEEETDEPQSNNSLVRTKTISDLQEMTEEGKEELRDTKEDENMIKNINSTAKGGDLSLRQIESMKSGMKRNHPSLPLQVQTRSSREKESVSN